MKIDGINCFNTVILWNEILVILSSKFSDRENGQLNKYSVSYMQ